ncbi:MAG: disulfide bond formation protein B [Tropicimonas sp.]|uniref:disulfide bond formation protein B n=1 Tax=Tropicimonas sp. TaxID=2067044 RepID=UPI003A8716C3
MSAKVLIALATALSLLSNVGALIAQYGLGILPCHLCLLQRYPHWLLSALGLASLLSGRIRLAWVGAAGALYSVGMAFYHSGVERQFWPGPSDCTGGQNLSGLSGADLLSTDIPVGIIRCDAISYSVLGLSFANMNLLISLALVWIWVAAARRA